MSCLCIIPARGGSKRIPHKNVKPFLGKPVIAWSIEAALKSGIFSEVMVSTDDEEIARVAREYEAKVPFMRSEETSGDYATTADVLLEVLGEYARRGQRFDHACCLYSTAPFITPERLREAYGKLSGDVDSIFSVVAYSYPVQRSLKIENGLVRMNFPQYRKSRSQDLQPVYHDAGQFYFFTPTVLQETGALWGDHTAAMVLSELEVQDLDTETDWQLAEMKMKLRG